MAQRSHGTTVTWHNGHMAQRSHGTTVTWHNGHMAQWSHGTTVTWHKYTPHSHVYTLILIFSHHPKNATQFFHLFLIQHTSNERYSTLIIIEDYFMTWWIVTGHPIIHPIMHHRIPSCTPSCTIASHHTPHHAPSHPPMHLIMHSLFHPFFILTTPQLREIQNNYHNNYIIIIIEKWLMNWGIGQSRDTTMHPIMHHRILSCTIASHHAPSHPIMHPIMHSLFHLFSFLQPHNREKFKIIITIITLL